VQSCGKEERFTSALLNKIASTEEDHVSTPLEKHTFLSATRPTIVRRRVLSREDKELKEIRKVEDYVKDLRRDVDKRFSALSEQMGPVRRRAVKAMSERPLLALGVAFVFGLALGVVISRSKD